jgi:hypothetical protein
VRRPIDRLFADGLISHREWKVACAYRDMHAAAFGSLLGASRLDHTRHRSRAGMATAQPNHGWLQSSG